MESSLNPKPDGNSSYKVPSNEMLFKTAPLGMSPKYKTNYTSFLTDVMKDKTWVPGAKYNSHVIKWDGS